MIFAFVFTLLVNLLRLFLAPFVALRRARAAPRGAFVHLVIDGAIVAMAPRRSRLPWAPRPPRLAIDRVRDVVTALLADPKPAGLLVTIRSLHAAPAHRTALRAELARVRAAGRPLVVHVPSGGGTAELFLASVADRVLIGAETTLGPLGFRSGTLYFRRALDRLGVVPDVHAAGAYKSAGEPLMRDSMSEAQAEQSGRLLDVLHEELVAALSEGRGLAKDAAIAAIDQGLVSAADAVARGLADAVVHDDEVPFRLLGERTDEKIPLVAAGRYLRRRTARYFRRFPRPRIAIVELHGPIVEQAPVHMGNVCEADRVVPVLDALAENHWAVAVVLHVDSPGGGVLASEKIHRAVARLAAKKPVVACFGGVAASGGYYVSAPAACIVAARTTITGSIGVVAARMIAAPLLERLGITPQAVTRGARIDMLSPLRDFDEGERAAFDAEIDRAYRRFVALVAEGRHRTEEEIRPLAGGRVWSGVDAHERGLVDRLGGLDLAIDEARSRSGLTFAEPVLVASRRPVPPFSLARFLPMRSLDALGLRPLADTAQLSLGTRERVWAVALVDRLLG